MPASHRIAYGDWQTPADLADRVTTRVLGLLPSPPRAVLEPTCGEGAFLAAAARLFPESMLCGFEINPAYVEVAASKIPILRGQVRQADFFSVDWDHEMKGMPDPLLVIGNPPWVTSAALGALGANNHPEKRNTGGVSGIEAITGKSNFDVSEWMILRLLRALSMERRDATLAMLCKASVARRVLSIAGRERLPISPGAMFQIDAARHFDASVDAVLFIARIAPEASPSSVSWRSWPLYPSLEAPCPKGALGLDGGALVADVEAHARTRHLGGTSDPAWRSGLKHDAARVMELSLRGADWVNGEGEIVDVEPELRYPLLKSSDVAHGRRCPERAVLVPQRALREDTLLLRDRAPRLFAYLSRHQSSLDARRSAIYRGKPPFAIFGIGPYSFAPWKVAVSGLYKRLHFEVVGPHEGRPVMLDDTCYFLPFSNEEEATRAAVALDSDLARDFFRGRVFWDAKRPINKAVLQALDLTRLLAIIP